MAQQTIGIGTVANDGTGDTLRDAGDKINDNFTELYAADAALGTAAPLDIDTDDTLAANSDSLIPTQQAVKAYVDNELASVGGGSEAVTILVSDPNGSAITTGDGKAYFRVPSILNGLDLTSVAAALTTASSSGIPTIQIHNLTQAADMLTTKITIDASETDSSTAAAAAVIDTANDDVATGDMLRIDIDVAGTGAKGLIVEMQFS